jgi:hypothetical protein
MNINQTMSAEEPILTRSISDFQISDEFKYMCGTNSFRTMGDILQYDTSQLLTRPAFNYRMLKELYSLLKAFDKQHILRD